MKASIVVFVLALAVALSGYAFADQAGVLGKIDSAAKLSADKKAGQAAADLEEAVQMIKEDAAQAGDIAKAMANATAAFIDAHHGVVKGEIPDSVFNIARSNVKDFYGAILPAAKGDFAAAAAYINGLANAASGDLKSKLQAAASGLSDAAAGKGDKAKAFAIARATLGATAKLYEASEKAGEKGGGAANLIESVEEYVHAEASLIRESGDKETLRDFKETVGDLGIQAHEFRAGINTEIDPKQADGLVAMIADASKLPTGPAPAPKEKPAKAEKKMESTSK